MEFRGIGRGSSDWKREVLLLSNCLLAVVWVSVFICVQLSLPRGALGLSAICDCDMMILHESSCFIEFILRDFKNTPFYILFHIIDLRMFLCPQRNFGRHIVIALSVRPSRFRVRSISPIFFEVGIPNLVSGYILGWRSVAYHFRVTVTLTSDLVFRIIVSGAYLLYYLR